MRFGVTMTDDFYKKLKEEATKSGMGLSEYIRYAINVFWGIKNGR